MSRPAVRTADDGRSRPFAPDTTRSARQIVARVLAERDGWAEIRPGHWAEAGAIVAALRARDLLR